MLKGIEGISFVAASTGAKVILTVFLGPVTLFTYQTLLPLGASLLFFPTLFPWEIVFLLFGLSLQVLYF